jgi:hypothetical protein
MRSLRRNSDMVSTTFAYSRSASRVGVVAITDNRSSRSWMGSQFDEIRAVDANSVRTSVSIRWSDEDAELIQTRNDVGQVVSVVC